MAGKEVFNLSGATRTQPQSSVPPSPRLEAPLPSRWAPTLRPPRPGPLGQVRGARLAEGCENTGLQCENRRLDL